MYRPCGSNLSKSVSLQQQSSWANSLGKVSSLKLCKLQGNYCHHSIRMCPGRGPIRFQAQSWWHGCYISMKVVQGCLLYSQVKDCLEAFRKRRHHVTASGCLSFLMFISSFLTVVIIKISFHFTETHLPSHSLWSIVSVMWSNLYFLGPSWYSYVSTDR